MWRPTLALLLIVLTSAGCSLMMPPQKIPMDRRNYLDAVSTSWKEQLLTNLVKLRYGDTLTFLEMTSITTGYELGGTVSAGFSSSGHPLLGTTGFRNTVTTGGAVAYLDKPTISYIPVRGDALAKTLMSPIPATNILKSLQTGWRADFIFACCVKSINHLQNRSPTRKANEGDPDFFLLAQHIRELQHHGVIRITIDPVVKETTEQDTTWTENEPKKQEKNKPIKKGKAKEKISGAPSEVKSLYTLERSDMTIASIFVDKGRAKTHELKFSLNEFIKLLGLNGDLTQYKVINGNRQSIQCEPISDKIVMHTRSIMEILTMLSNFIKVPDDHANELRASKGNLVGEALNANNENIKEKDRLLFTIHSGKTLPPDSFVGVKYQDMWFYIKDNDVTSKQIFSNTLLFFSMSESGTTAGTPVLTLPVQ